MSQQSHWKASALAATLSTNAGFSGTAWGAARPPHHMNSEIGFGLGFGAAPTLGGSGHSGRQKRKASSEDESMGSSSPTPEPAGSSSKTRAVVAARRHGANRSSDRDGMVYHSHGMVEHRDGMVEHSSASAAESAAESTAVDRRKRTRMAHAAAPSEVALDKLLEPLEEQSLRQLLDTLLAQNPALGAQVRQLVPKPTVTSACSQLVRLERRLQAAFPYSKAGPATDDYAFHRVRPALEELRDTITMYLDHFTHHGLASARAAPEQPPPNALSHPAEWFDLLAQAADVAARMPRWDRAEHNAIRRDTLRQLADGWLRAVMATRRWTDEGHIVGRDMLAQWARQLARVYASEPALLHPAVQAFEHSFGQQQALRHAAEQA